MSQLDDLISEVNELNKVFESKNIDLNAPYEDITDNKNLACYVYQGEDKEEHLKKYESLYVNPFNIFVTHDDENKNIDKLYICKLKFCSTPKIDSSEIQIIKDDEEGIKGLIHGQEFELVYDYDEERWKFVDSLLVC